MYIEKYHYNLEFDVENYFSQFCPGIDYEPSWPLICVSGSRLKFSAAKGIWEDLLGEKKRTKPSNCINGGQESVAAAINKALGMTGITFNLMAACTSGAYALHQAGLISQIYDTPVVIAAADNVIGSQSEIFYFHSIGALDMDTGIPFDKNSKGFRPGKGQCFFVVSHKPINPQARINDMRFFTQPNERTAVGSLDDIKINLFNGIDFTNISWWNAHAPGTPMGDQAEYGLFSSVCGDIPISSIKGTTGHLLVSSYLVELAIALESVAAGFAKGNVKLTNPINDDVRIIQTDTPINNGSFLKFNMGFNGRSVLSLIDVL